MGLDMYIMNSDDYDNVEVAYWRKEHELHDIFNEIADYKDIQYKDFNCVQVPLTVKDIDYALNSLHIIELYEREYTKERLIHAKFMIGTGANLYYDSWW